MCAVELPIQETQTKNLKFDLTFPIPNQESPPKFAHFFFRSESHYHLVTIEKIVESLGKGLGDPLGLRAHWGTP